MAGYTKLFNSILHSTIWSESNETRIVWLTMLAMCEKNGTVNASIPGLARAANVTIEEVQVALECLLSPDEFSRTTSDEGRRIKEIDGGWFLLNHGKYRAKMNVEERKEYNRIAKQEERKRKKEAENAAKALNESMTVNDCRDKSALSAHSESDSESDSKPLVPPKSPKGEWRPDETQSRLNALFSRRASNEWSPKMIKAYRAIDFDEAEIRLVERFHADPTAFKRTALPTLLNNWDTEVDRARNHLKRKTVSDGII